MKELPKISDTEWAVMKALWSTSPQTANEIVEELSASSKWKPKTIKTLISRLVQKKALGFDNDSRTYNYYPLVSEDECIKAESKSFLQKVYGGAANVMLASFLKEEKLTKEEIEELRRILDERER